MRTSAIILVLALGVFQNAKTREQWEASLGETARVLKPEGRLLVSNFSPRSEPEGRKLIPAEGEANVYRGFGQDALYLIEAETLDRDMARHGLIPVMPAESVVIRKPVGFRVTVNGHYLKGGTGTDGG